MSAPAVAIVDAKTSGNVGTIARAMKNFGFEDLLLVEPPDVGPESEAWGFAGQAREDILPSAAEITFDELADTYHTVGFTAITNENGASHVRWPFQEPADLADSLVDVETDTALVFGREDVGLTNEEMARLDRVCSIPAGAEYPVLNLGQAATIALYELRGLTGTESQLPEITDRADAERIEGLLDQFGALLDAIGYREVKRAKTARLWRRLIGRAHPTEREVTTLRGVLRRASERAQEDDHGPHG